MTAVVDRRSTLQIGPRREPLQVKTMSTLAQLMYRALVWKERQRARRAALGTPLLSSKAEHLKTGVRGETLAFWYLRQAGYTIVARNRRARSGAGEIDLIGWDGQIGRAHV